MLNEKVERPAAFVVETDLVDSDARGLLLVVDNSTNRPRCIVKVLPETQLIGLVKITTDFPCVPQYGVLHFRRHITERKVRTPSLPEELITEQGRIEKAAVGRGAVNIPGRLTTPFDGDSINDVLDVFVEQTQCQIAGLTQRLLDFEGKVPGLR